MTSDCGGSIDESSGNHCRGQLVYHSVSGAGRGLDCMAEAQEGQGLCAAIYSDRLHTRVVKH